MAFKTYRPDGDTKHISEVILLRRKENYALHSVQNLQKNIPIITNRDLIIFILQVQRKTTIRTSVYHCTVHNATDIKSSISKSYSCVPLSKMPSNHQYTYTMCIVSHYFKRESIINK